MDLYYPFGQSIPVLSSDTYIKGSDKTPGLIRPLSTVPMSTEPEFEVQLLDEVESSQDSPVNIPTGEYYVRNRSKGPDGVKDYYAGRNHIEDKSLHPKKVHCPTDGPFELASAL
jgi:hypothetical protein